VCPAPVVGVDDLTVVAYHHVDGVGVDPGVRGVCADSRPVVLDQFGRGGRDDLAVPGHDVPFYVTDGGAEPCGDVAVELAAQTGAGTGTRVRVASDRGRTRVLPESVADRTPGMLD